MSTRDKLPHPVNAFAPITLTPTGKSTRASAPHPANARSPTISTPAGILTCVSAAQPSQNPAGKLDEPPRTVKRSILAYELGKQALIFTNAGHITVTMFAQPENAVAATFVTPFGIVTDVNCPPANAYPPISVVPSGISSSVKSSRPSNHTLSVPTTSDESLYTFNVNRLTSSVEGAHA